MTTSMLMMMLLLIRMLTNNCQRSSSHPAPHILQIYFDAAVADSDADAAETFKCVNSGQNPDEVQPEPDPSIGVCTDHHPIAHTIIIIVIIVIIIIIMTKVIIMIFIVNIITINMYQLALYQQKSLFPS